MKKAIITNRLIEIAAGLICVAGMLVPLFLYIWGYGI